ncbi:carboxymethylenebutenolidase [Xylariales sp. PMI_506]|nr:carboxymethylenebutenolidase [Xylariales sp. PMI_506]
MAGLPSAPVVTLAPNASLQPPLSRRGYGPGLIIVDPGYVENSASTTLDPMPQKKWAEEGYAVIRLTFKKDSAAQEGEWSVEEALGKAVDALVSLESCDTKDKFGLLVYGSVSEYGEDFASKLKTAYSTIASILGAVVFSADWDLSVKPEVVHLSGKSATALSRPNTASYKYPQVASATFIVPGAEDFNYSAAGVAHTRSLTFLKKHLQGPIFDLEVIWDEHTYFEFEDRSVEKTMATMVDEPYVNHVPTITGGIGRAKLTNFYRDHFIFNNPDDTGMELVSRTIGIDRVVDEFIFTMIHDKEVDWLIPGVPPTNKPLRIPFCAVVNIRGDRLYHEHITWDQATVLRQLGLLPEYLPFPYPLPDGTTPAAGKKFEYKVPALGVETAKKLQDQNSVESNELFQCKVREVDA